MFLCHIELSGVMQKQSKIWKGIHDFYQVSIIIELFIPHLPRRPENHNFSFVDIDGQPIVCSPN